MRSRKLWFSAVLALGVSSVALMGCGQQTADTSKVAGKEWPAVGGDWGNTRFSSLKQVTTANAKDLGAAWVRKFDQGRPTGTPIISGGKMFVTTSTDIYALNPKTGEVIWSQKSPHPIHGTYKGSAVGEGLLFVGTGNGRLLAMKQDTGEQVWDGLVADEEATRGQFIAAGPTYANGVVVVPMANGDFGIRGRVVGFDAKTGQQLWRFNTVAAHKGQPGYESWPQDHEDWQPGGAGVWVHGAYDPELGLVYYGTGNPIPQWGGELRKGDNLYGTSAIALDAKTGELKWHYQIVRHDVWEADLGTPLILFDAEVGGKTTKAIGVLSTYGQMFMLDRATGQPVWPVEERPVPQNARIHTAPTQPFLVGADQIGPTCVQPDMIPKGFKALCHFDPVDYDTPNAMYPILSTRAAPATYNPETKAFYASGAIWPYWIHRFEDPKFFNAGASVPGIKYKGLHAALDAKTNKILWQKEVPYQVQQNGSGFVSTAGGLLVRGNADGTVEAYDAKAGDLLWQFQTGGSANQPPAVYEVDGEQHIAIASGTGFWAFKLGGKVEPLPAPPKPATETSFGGRIIPTEEIVFSPTVQDSGLEFVREAVDEYGIAPQRAKVSVGQKVTWTNKGKFTKEATAVDGSWTTGPIAPGASTTLTFDEPGVFTYNIKEHEWSYGELTVEE
jgi:quinohemoprotein ethanol dehydrogenase